MGIHIMPPLYKMVIVPPGPAYGPPVTVKFYPDRDPEVTSVDGYAMRSVAYSTWSNIHDGDGTDASDISTTEWINIRSCTDANAWRYIRRTAILLDTSSIPEGSLKEQASLHLLCGTLKNTLGGNPAVGVYQSDPLSNTEIVPADYQRFSSVPLSNIIPMTDLVEDEWAVLNLNDAGLALVIPNGITKLGIREATYDAADTPPPWSSYKVIDMRFSSAESPFEKKPYLEVTYRPPL